MRAGSKCERQEGLTAKNGDLARHDPGQILNVQNQICAPTQFGRRERISMIDKRRLTVPDGFLLQDERANGSRRTALSLGSLLAGGGYRLGGIGPLETSACAVTAAAIMVALGLGGAFDG